MAEWIDTEEAHQISGYSLFHLRRLLRENKVTGKKKGGAYWIDRASLEAYLKSASEADDKRHGPKNSSASDLDTPSQN